MQLLPLMAKKTAVGILLMLAISCKNFEDLPPEAPTVPTVPFVQFNITGSWEGQTNQGRNLRFDVRSSGNLVKGSISVHHDCSGGRTVLAVNGFDTKIGGGSFAATATWRKDDPGGKFYTGILSISGSFEGDRVANGGFVNSITDKQADNLGTCGPSSGTWTATKSQ